MARIKLTDDLKKAISGLSSTQKDKLLYRLIAGNPALAHKLIFELLEGGNTQDDRRAAVATEINSTLTNYEAYYHTPGILLLQLRDLSGVINRHVSTTRDKYGEVELNLLMVNECFQRFGDRIRVANYPKARTFNEYVVKRALKLLTLLEKMHEDMRLDFKTDLKKLGKYIAAQPTTMMVAKDLMLEVDRLLHPND
ncbi:MAG: hypothetical protein SH848_03520 [Saprospiraceae bacterium]|nr:hypothetical protein [Saprospiraceae bacterium]MDZ4702970.1 hypothetical protein [Saprospiraceae bacterium]